MMVSSEYVKGEIKMTVQELIEMLREMPQDELLKVYDKKGNVKYVTEIVLWDSEKGSLLIK